jgi:hypothetical protein
LAVDIDQATISQQVGHPSPFFGQETRIFFVAFEVLQVNFLVCDVDVATQNELALTFQAQLNHVST